MNGCRQHGFGCRIPDLLLFIRIYYLYVIPGNDT